MKIIGEYATKLGVPTPLFTASAPVYTAAMAQGFDKQDTAAVCAVLVAMAGCKRSPAAIIPVNTYACSVTRIPTRQASTIECQKTKRRIEPSWPNQLVAVEATTIDCASIILPITPPEELAALIRIGASPSCSEVIFCRPPKSTFEAVSDPVSATPSQPSSAPKNGYSTPVCANASPSVASRPEKRVSVPMPSIAMIVSSE